MHEASLAAGVLQLVDDTAQREGFSRVLQLRLEVGQLAGVEVQALRFALTCIAPDTRLEGAQIEIIESPGQGWCLGCQQSVTIEQRGQPCPLCDSHQIQATGGMELRVLDLQVSDD